MDRIFVQDLKVGTTITSSFLVRAKHQRRKKTGDPFLTFSFGDCTGEISGVLWEDCEEVDRLVQVGDFVFLKALVGSYQGSLQLSLQEIRRLDSDTVDPGDFFASTPKDVDAMVQYLVEVADGLKSPHLRSLLHSFLRDQSFLSIFKESAAAKGLHHVYRGGLLEHTASVVKICHSIVHHYEGIHGDLVLTGAALHDVGKVQELESVKGLPDYSDQGRLLGHIMIGAQMVRDRIRSLPEFPPPLELQLLHIIVSHHGEHIWGSPQRPQTVEALIVHHIEDLDAKVMGFQQFMMQSKDPQRPRWTSYHKAFERYLYLGDTEDEGPQGG